MAKVLTTRPVEAAKPNPAKRVEIPDAALPGLYLVVQPSGAKSWALRYRAGGKPRKLTVGRYPLLGLKDAREEAGKALHVIERGQDPAAEKRTAKADAQQAAASERDKLKTIIEQFMRRHASRNRRADEVQRLFDREVIPRWGERRAHDITRRDVVELLDRIVDRGSPITANRLLAHLKTLFGWAKARDVIAAAPTDGLRPPAAEKSRDRILTDVEIRWFWQAAAMIGQPFGPLYQMLLLTGQRLREVAEMTEQELSGDVWTIGGARAKNGDAHQVPLSDPAKAVLGGVKRIKGAAGYVFTTSGSTPVSGFAKAKMRLDKAMAEVAAREAVEQFAPSPFVIHDLRRTAASGIARLGFPVHVVEKVLNHRGGTFGGIVSVYNRHDYANEKRAALEAWALLVLDIAARAESDQLASYPQLSK